MDSNDARAAPKETLASLSAPYQTGRDWYRVREDAISFPPARSKKGTRGPRSLMEMGLRTLADNIGAAPTSSIQDLSGKLKRALWKELAPRTMSLEAWDVLSSDIEHDAYASAARGRENKEQEDKKDTISLAMRRYCQEILDPPCELSVYTTPLGGLDDCLVHLCIDNVARFEKNEMLSLAKLKHLAALEIIERGPTSNGVDDFLIWGWSKAVEDISERRQAFSSLRVLKITSRGHAVTPRSLPTVLKFPCLEIFDITPTTATEWPEPADIELDPGWKVTKPRGSVFESYATAYLTGLKDLYVNIKNVDALRTVFEDDRCPVALVDDPRRAISNQLYDQLVKENPDKDPDEIGLAFDGPDLSDYLDQGWREFLQGTHPLSTSTNLQGGGGHQSLKDMTDDQVFWFLALLDQKDCNDEDWPVQAQAAGLTLPWKRFASLRLCCLPVSAEENRRLRNHERLIFSRRRNMSTEASDALREAWHRVANLESRQSMQRRVKLEMEARDKRPPSWATRTYDRTEKDLKPRKRQKTTDLFSSLGI